jgi:hypothetical protein
MQMIDAIRTTLWHIVGDVEVATHIQTLTYILYSNM